MLAPFLFFLFAVLAIAAAVGMLIARSPISCALWMVLNLFSIAMIYLTLHAQFIAVVQILVYAGAIMVLFLFVIMLLNLDVVPEMGKLNWRKVVAFVLGVVVLAQLLLAVALGLDLVPDAVAPEQAAEVASAGSIGLVLFSDYGYLLQIVAVFLLAATIGAVLLAKKHLS